MSATDPGQILHTLADLRPGRLTHVREVMARPARSADLPRWVDPALAAALAGAGLGRLWSHQREAADAAYAGQDVVVATGTASGKSLGYLLPALSVILEGCRAPGGRGATALYLAPTKALAADQLAHLDALALPGLRAATYDGDTPPEERRWAREHAAYVLSNPDMLHHGLLPGHQRWSPYLRSLRYVVVDECHGYRGLFGSHVALVLRRLRRVCARYRADPTFVFASATTADPAAQASALLGRPVRAVVDDGSPREPLTFALWEPETEPDGVRTSTLTESADLMADLVTRGVQTVTFARSRAAVEVVADRVRSQVQPSCVPSAADPTPEVAAYRGGYLPEERRILERDLRSGRLRGLAATSALELGVDVAGLDAVVMAGWPGTLASLWQQAGRAGRRGERALAILVAADDPLDTFLVHHPAAIFDRPVEQAVLDPENPHLLGPHLACAAAELPATSADATYFGATTTGTLDGLAARGMLRRRPTGWYWTRPDSPSAMVSLRGAGSVVRITESHSGRVLGVVDQVRAHGTVHPGAVYVHQGETYVVTELELADGVALVVRGHPGWTTQAQSVSAFDILNIDQDTSWGPVRAATGAVRVRTRVTSFLRRLPSGEVVGEHPLDLPEQILPTQAVWWTVPPDVLDDAGVCPAAVAGALHAAEHASIGVLPLIATADRWDIGGVSTALHPDTGLPTVLVYDGCPGGAGFARRGYHDLAPWLTMTLRTITTCRCASGCPSCVQSPKCGNGNEPLDKAGAVRLLRHVLGARTP